MAQTQPRVDDAVSMEALIRHQLILLGEDPAREGLRDTPERVKESLEFLTRGYRMTLDDVFGDAVFTEADHLCMKMRGVEKQNSRVFTSCVLGIFQADSKTRAEFMGLIKGVPNI